MKKLFLVAIPLLIAGGVAVGACVRSMGASQGQLMGLVQARNLSPEDAARALKTFVPVRPGPDRRYAIDATKIRRERGWAPRWSFEEGLRETVRWYLEHRAWCEEVQAGRYARERLGLG